MGNIKCISFDLWETIIQDHFQFDARIAILDEFLNTKGLKIPKKTLKNRYMEKAGGYAEFITQESDYRHVSYQTRLRKFFNSFDLDVSEEEMEYISSQFNQVFLDDPPQFYSDIVKILPKLSESYQIILISDTGFIYGNTMRELLKRNNLLKHFSHCYFSDETGHYKPHPKAFKLAEKQTGFSPYEMVHIGDRIDTDVVGANRNGWWSGLIVNHDENRWDLFQDSQKNHKLNNLKLTGQEAAEIVKNREKKRELEKIPDFVLKKWEEIWDELKKINS
ncbi:MAG: HAD family hydrolase [Promethearchaeota archaeon]